MNRESILFKRESGDGIFSLLIIRCLTIIFIQLKAIIGTRENINIQLTGILNAAPPNLRRQWDNRASFRKDWNIFQCGFDSPPLTTRKLLAIKEVEPSPSWDPDLL